MTAVLCEGQGCRIINMPARGYVCDSWLLNGGTAAMPGATGPQVRPQRQSQLQTGRWTGQLSARAELTRFSLKGVAAE